MSIRDQRAENPTENHRRAKFYRLSRAGRKQLETETREWHRIAFAIAQALESA